MLRSAVDGDAEPLTGVYLRSRGAAMPWLVSPHDEASTLRWFKHVVLAEQQVWVAVSGDRLLGFAAVDGQSLEQLYIDPDDQGHGIGRALLDAAKEASPSGLSLHIFTRNDRARLFYESAGFTLVEQRDGSGNEEREPDCIYSWPLRTV